MDFVVLIGRILYALLAVGAALGGHFGATADTAAYGESRGLKNARFWVLASGAWLLAGGLMVIIGFYPDLGALMFGFYTLVAAVVIHHFWTDDDQMIRTGEMSNFMKNLSITGGSLMAFAYFVTVGEAGPFQITGNLIDL